MGEHTQKGAVNIYSEVNGKYVVDKVFSDAGLTDFNPDVRTIYACSDYLKMGAGDKQTGIILPALAIPEGQATDIELTFVAASNIGGDGTGKPDASRHSRGPRQHKRRSGKRERADDTRRALGMDTYEREALRDYG